jgi:ABC-2 type transport system permease protein
MWLLSGAFFPADSGWLAWIIRLNPLTYGVAGLRALLQLETGTAASGTQLALCWGVTLLFALLLFALAWKIAGRRTTGDLL